MQYEVSLLDYVLGLAHSRKFGARDRDYAERCGDIWLRSAPTDKAAERRKAALKNLGLPDTVAFL